MNTLLDNGKKSRVVFDEGQYWVQYAKNGRRHVSNNPRSNKKRMYVDGKYVPQSHPLWKSGRYSSFNDAAFSSLVNYNASPKGDVYIITNKAWPEWFKVDLETAVSCIEGNVYEKQAHYK